MASEVADWLLVGKTRDRDLRNELVLEPGWLARHCVTGLARRGESVDDSFMWLGSAC
jgi:hypothetical protein